MPKIVDHDKRRAELCAVAAKLIARGGLDAATTRQIAQASGYSKGVVEHYFENKGELISGALDWADQHYQQRAARKTADLQGLAALKARLLATVPLTTAMQDEWKIRLQVWSMAAIDPLMRKRQAQRHLAAVQQFAADIVMAAEIGELMSGDAAEMHARRIVLAASGLSTAALHNPRAYSRAVLEREVQYIIARLRADAL